MNFLKSAVVNAVGVLAVLVSSSCYADFDIEYDPVAGVKAVSGTLDMVEDECTRLNPGMATQLSNLKKGWIEGNEDLLKRAERRWSYYVDLSFYAEDEVNQELSKWRAEIAKSVAAARPKAGAGAPKQVCMAMMAKVSAGLREPTVLAVVEQLRKETSVDPHQAILGKWVSLNEAWIRDGTLHPGILPKDNYMEFKPDGTWDRFRDGDRTGGGTYRWTSESSIETTVSYATGRGVIGTRGREEVDVFASSLTTRLIFTQDEMRQLSKSTGPIYTRLVITTYFERLSEP